MPCRSAEATGAVGSQFGEHWPEHLGAGGLPEAGAPGAGGGGGAPSDAPQSNDSNGGVTGGTRAGGEEGEIEGEA